eukprot:1867854-Prymnesium_polylepis.2
MEVARRGLSLGGSLPRPRAEDDGTDGRNERKRDKQRKRRRRQQRAFGGLSNASGRIASMERERRQHQARRRGGPPDAHTPTEDACRRRR